MPANEVLNNRYRLLASVGEGGMAIVYRAEDTLLGRPVAVKVLRDHLANDQAFLTRFQDEARAAASLSHPHIVAIFDVGQDAGRHYIVMEYVDGPTLKELISQGAPFPVGRTVELATQILLALELAHQRGIVHRDIKPQNVLLTADGRAKVADFGIARLPTASPLTQAGEVFGTAFYLAPERASGHEATPAADVYGVGVLLYEMLTGRLPFTGESTIEVALKHLQQLPTPPRHLNPAVPPHLEEIVLQAMAKDPTQRFATAKEMKQALLSYQRATADTTAGLALGGRAPAAAAVGAGRAATRAAAFPSDKTGARGFSWLVLLLLAATIALAALMLPLSRLFYDTYLGPLLTGPQATAPAVVVPTGTPTPTVTPTGTPTPTVTGTPTATATPTATPTPLYPAWTRYVVVERLRTPVRDNRQQLSEVTGRILDQQGNLVPGLRIMIEAEGGWKDYRPRPGIDVADGTFRFDQLSPGRYRVTIVDDAGNPLSQAADHLVTDDLPQNIKGYIVWDITFRQVQ